jgi:uncharacterized cupredoxin-like copper-binding protein
MHKHLKLFRSIVVIGLVLLTLAACVPGAAPVPAATAAPAAVPTTTPAPTAAPVAESADSAVSPNNAVVRIMAQEMSFTPSMNSAPAGQVTFLVVNQGKLPHEVVVLRTDMDAKALPVTSSNKVDESAAGDHVGEVEVEAGSTGAGTFRLTPGKYVLICNIEGHYQAGMTAAFAVTGTPSEPLVESKPPAAPAAAAAPAASGERKEVGLVKAVRPNLVNTIDALKKGDLAGAKKAFAEYDAAWNGIEVYVNYRSPQLYADLETDLQAKIQKALDDPASKAEDITPLVEQELAKWDEAVKLVSSGPEISPLFDDIAALRMLRAATIRRATPLLTAGDAATAAPLLQNFINSWADIEDLIHARSVDAYSQTEAAMAAVNTALQKANPDAKELTPLVARLTNRFNYGLSFINGAARGSDLKKTTYSAEDVQAAATLAMASSELKASLASWKSANYQESANHAKLANDLFAKVTPALKAMRGNNAAVQTALDAYIALADKAGDADTVSAANLAVAELLPVSQQWFVGQFWGDPKLQDAVKAAMNGL